MNKELLEKYKDFLKARNFSSNYYNVIKIFFNYLDTKNLEFSNVTQETLTEFFNINEYSANSKNQFLKAGRNYGDYLQIPKEDNVFYQTKLIAVEHKIPDFLSEEEVERAKRYLITNNSKKMSPTKIRAIVSFLYATATRKTEFLKLKRADIDLVNNKCKLFGKGKKERYVYFNDKVKKELEEYFKSEAEELNAFNISLGRLHYMVKLMSKYLNKKVYLHLLRHSSARNMVMKDIPINIISKILGHSSTQSTLRYIDPSEQMISDKYQEKMK